MKTPGVYIVEKNAFPNSVVEVASAVPAFVGYTQMASINNKSVLNKPVRITSIAEFHAFFGFRSEAKFDLVESAQDAEPDVSLAGKGYSLFLSSTAYQLYQSMQMFYLNGGGPCYIVSVGNYSDDINKDKLLAGIEVLIKEQEPTVLIIPDAVSLPAADCYAVQGQMIMHCGSIMRSRFAILDIHDGYQNVVDSVAAFRSSVPNEEGGDFAAAYYPWLNTTLLSDLDVSFLNLSAAGKTVLKEVIYEQLCMPGGDLAVLIAALDGESEYSDAEIDTALRASSTYYLAVLKEIKQRLNLLPPSSAMAGLYTMTDSGRGVWKAPVNIGVQGAVGPAFEISADEQENLNVDVSGKSVNAIRVFPGEGTLVWGARTLDGNSLDWRYINVRRTMIMLEQSVKLAAKAYVFEPNQAQTWVTVKSMISNFLDGIWKRGGLAGALPTDAFSVHVGLNETMTSEDILKGILRVKVLVAISRPAEFIEITFQQQMHKS